MKSRQGMILARLIEQTISEVKVEKEVRVEVAIKPLKRAQIGSYNLTYINSIFNIRK